MVLQHRTEMRVSRGELGLLAQIERSHMGEIERGQHLLNLALILRLAGALKTSPGGLVDLAAAQLAGSAEGSPD